MKRPATLKYRTKASLGKDSVHDAWDRLEAWLARHLPDTRKALNPPAKVSEIKHLEATIGQELPAELRESYRRHNGQKERAPGVIFGLPLDPLDFCLAQWKHAQRYEREKAKKQKPPVAGKRLSKFDKFVSQLDLDKLATCFPTACVQQFDHSTYWLPISHDGGGNSIAIDLGPGPQGKHGQVIVMGRDDTFHPVLAWDFAQFLTDIATELERGNWTITTIDPDWFAEFILSVPQQNHFHEAGADWSRHKLGLRTLSRADQAIWNKWSLLKRQKK